MHAHRSHNDYRLHEFYWIEGGACNSDKTICAYRFRSRFCDDPGLKYIQGNHVGDLNINIAKFYVKIKLSFFSPDFDLDRKSRSSNSCSTKINERIMNEEKEA